MSTTNDSGWNTDPLKNPKRKMESVLPAPTLTNNLKVAAAAAVKLPQADSGLAKQADSGLDSGPSLGQRSKLVGAKINSSLTSETAQGIYSGIGAATDIATQFIDWDTTKNPTGFSSQQTVGDALLKSGNPYLCCCEGTKVYINTGEQKNIEDLSKSDGIIGFDEGCFLKQPILNLFPSCIKECVEIETSSGEVLRCSIDHPIYSAKAGRGCRTKIEANFVRIKQFGFKEAGSLKPGDFVAKIGKLDIFGNKNVKDAYLVGLLIGDGTYGKNHGVRLFTGDPCTWKYIEDNNLGIQINDGQTEGKYNKEFRCYKFYNHVSLLRELGIYGQTKINKRLPINIHEWDKGSCAKLLAGLFDTDGCVYNSNKDKRCSQILFYQSNYELLSQIKDLLIKFGIHSCISKKNAKDKVIKNRTVHSKEYWVLSIKRRESVINFYNNIHLNIKYKQNALNDFYFQKLEDGTKDNSYEYCGVVADRIVKIKNIGSQTVYNLEADLSHTYLANNIITHNTAAGAAYKALSGIAEATGGNINTITKDQAKDIGVNKWERFGNNVLGVIPGLGWGVQETSKGQKSHLIDEMSNAYADSVSDINQAQTLGGSKFLFGRNKIEDSIQQANWRNKQLTEINLTNTMRKKSDYAQDLAQQNLNRYMGTNYMDMRMGKQGMKFPELDDIREMLKNRVLAEENVQKFADGGSILPTGKLHKERHHIESVSPDLEDVITKKGIPVVTMDEGGSLVAVAEIERDEWTLSKEFTDQIEALWKDGSEEAMIECGKLVCEELLRNTQDSSNILGKEEEDE